MNSGSGMVGAAVALVVALPLAWYLWPGFGLGALVPLLAVPLAWPLSRRLAGRDWARLLLSGAGLYLLVILLGALGEGGMVAVLFFLTFSDLSPAAEEVVSRGAVILGTLFLVIWILLPFLAARYFARKRNRSSLAPALGGLWIVFSLSLSAFLIQIGAGFPGADFIRLPVPPGAAMGILLPEEESVVAPGSGLLLYGLYWFPGWQEAGGRPVHTMVTVRPLALEAQLDDRPLELAGQGVVHWSGPLSLAPGIHHIEVHSGPLRASRRFRVSEAPPLRFRPLDAPREPQHLVEAAWLAANEMSNGEAQAADLVFSGDALLVAIRSGETGWKLWTMAHRPSPESLKSHLLHQPPRMVLAGPDPSRWSDLLLAGCGDGVFLAAWWNPDEQLHLRWIGGAHHGLERRITRTEVEQTLGGGKLDPETWRDYHQLACGGTRFILSLGREERVSPRIHLLGRAGKPWRLLVASGRPFLAGSRAWRLVDGRILPLERRKPALSLPAPYEGEEARAFGRLHGLFPLNRVLRVQARVNTRHWPPQLEVWHVTAGLRRFLIESREP